MSLSKDAEERWRADYSAQLEEEKPRRNRSNIALKPLYGPADWDGERHLRDLGYPGAAPMTRGIHASMHRGRPWSPRLVGGLGLPEDYNARMRARYDAGLTGLFLTVSPAVSAP